MESHTYIGFFSARGFTGWVPRSRFRATYPHYLSYIAYRKHRDHQTHLSKSTIVVRCSFSIDFSSSASQSSELTSSCELRGFLGTASFRVFTCSWLTSLVLFPNWKPNKVKIVGIFHGFDEYWKISSSVWSRGLLVRVGEFSYSFPFRAGLKRLSWGNLT